jgi:hypothetical protein
MRMGAKINDGMAIIILHICFTAFVISFLLVNDTNKPKGIPSNILIIIAVTASLYVFKSAGFIMSFTDNP